MLYLRWTYQGNEYRRSLGLPDSPFNRNAAQGKASQIEHDIAMQQFDSTLDKYWPKPQTKPKQLSTVELWTKYMEFKREAGITSGQSISSRYKPMLNNLQHFGRDIATTNEAREFKYFLAERQSPHILNQNISLLKGFGEWCIEQEHWESNPFESIKRMKALTMKNPKRQPLSREEIQAFLQAIKTDKYYSGYHDFCMAMFYLGIRPSEAVGLRWKYIDWKRKTVTICESLSRSEDGRSAGYARQRKTTKNSKIREIDLHPDLYKMLHDQFKPEAKPEDLVFLSPKGNPIDDHNFSQRCWKKICQRIGIDKVPYAARHSLGSHLIENGATIPQTAAILGNNPETTARHYSHMLNRPKMPGFLNTSRPGTSEPGSP